MKYLTPQQHLRKLYLDQVKTYFKYFGLSFIGGIVLFILYICLTSGSDTQKMNECLQDHSLNYCNKEVK